MKRTLFCAVLGILICLCGCSKGVSYTTKYITNCESTEFHEEPLNSSAVICNLNYGEIVSFESDVQNGYSKVIYEGITGYVLSIYLSSEKPETETQVSDITEPVKDEHSEYKELISNQSEEEIEEYISDFVRPLYNKINENIDIYSKRFYGEATMWYDDNGCVKKELPQGANDYNMSRQYYYDTNSGEVVFAFIFKGTQEHRLYFNDGKLIRYIDEEENIVNNPTSTEALKMAERVILEAY